MIKLCCLIKPHGRCVNCGIRCCTECNRKRGRDGGSLGKCPAVGIEKALVDDHWITQEELARWQKGISYVKDFPETKVD